MVKRAVIGAVHFHQTDLPPSGDLSLPGHATDSGSPASSVASILLPVTATDSPLTATALVKLSFGGTAIAEKAVPINKTIVKKIRFNVVPKLPEFSLIILVLSGN